jgi:hypothetical protein
MMLNNLTQPRGAMWIPDSTSAGGHLWLGDAGFGFCRVDPLTGGNPPWQLSNCLVDAKAGAEIVVANPAPGVVMPTGTTKFVFVADSSSKSDNVVRYTFNPSTATMSNPVVITATPVNPGNGGTNGRTAGLALGPNGQDLYVGFIRTGDIMMISGATTNPPLDPTTGLPVFSINLVGSTSDGNGLNALALFKNDLYLAEQGGFGLSRIIDPAGLTRTACNPTAPCTAVTVTPVLSFFPGGLAADATNLYIGDSPLTTAGSLLQWNGTTLTSLSNAVSPAWTSNYDNATRSQYFDPFAVAVGPAAGEFFVGDDFSATLRIPVPPTLQGHMWHVPATPAPPVVTAISPSRGPTGGNTQVLISGSGFAQDNIIQGVPVAATQVMFGATAAASVTCASTTTCTAFSPSVVGPGTVDVQVIVASVTSPAVAADQFTYTAPTGSGAPVISTMSPASGVAGGGTLVTLTGTSLCGGSVSFGVTPARFISCTTVGTGDTFMVSSPAGSGIANVTVTNSLTALTSSGKPFTYVATPTASVYAWGITAPKGGMVWVPGNLGGHWWGSDHANGFCREDAVAMGAAVYPGGPVLRAVNSAICDNGSIGSPGQAVYDPTVNPAFNNSVSGLPVQAGTHFIYVPDNAVRSTAIWRLTFDPNSETIIGVPEAMVPLADLRTLKPNGMALGPNYIAGAAPGQVIQSGTALYVTDLVELNIRKVTGPAGDPRLQTVSIIAQTGDGRGANGTIGFIGNRLYISENRAASWFDVNTACATGSTGIPCTTTPLPIQPGAFVAGVATDAANGYVYASDSPGGANATIWRYTVATNTVVNYLQGGTLPASGSPNATVYCSTTCTRPWDPNLVPGGTGVFSFAFGLAVDPTNGSLFVTEDPTAGNRSGRGKAWVAPLVP